MIPHRLDPEIGKLARVGTPDSVQVLTTQEDGSCGMYRLSAVVWHKKAMSVALYGSEGTLIYDFLRDELIGGRHTDDAPSCCPFPATFEAAGRSRTTSSRPFAANLPVTHTDFATGVRYMQFTEAVARSSRHQIPVNLPFARVFQPQPVRQSRAAGGVALTESANKIPRYLFPLGFDVTAPVWKVKVHPEPRGSKGLDGAHYSEGQLALRYSTSGSSATWAFTSASFDSTSASCWLVSFNCQITVPRWWFVISRRSVIASNRSSAREPELRQVISSSS